MHFWHHIVQLVAATAVPKITISHSDIGVSNSTGTVSEGLMHVVQLLMGVLGALALIFLIVGGIQMAASVGDPKRFARGRETVTYAVIGMILAIAAFAVVSFIADKLK